MGMFASLGIGLGGCAGIHILGGSSDPAPQSVATVDKVDPAPGAVTGSVQPGGPLSYAGSDRSDWDLIRATVSASLSTPATARIEWANSTTGSSGTITDLTSSAAGKPRDCRSFAATIAAVDGVRLYHAEICKSVMNTWEFSKIAAADAQ